jgi:hypothetical protein
MVDTIRAFRILVFGLWSLYLVLGSLYFVRLSALLPIVVALRPGHQNKELSTKHQVQRTKDQVQGPKAKGQRPFLEGA